MSTAKKGISSELIAQDYFNRDPNNLVFVKAVQKKLGVRIVLVDETTGQIIIPEKK